MSSFRVMSKKSRLKLGIVVVVIIHIGMFYGFWRVHAKQIGDKVYEMDIYAAKAAEGLAFYEALPTSDCVNVKNEQAPKPGMPIVAIPDPKAPAPKQQTKTDKTKTPADVKREPSLYYATSPHCNAAVAAPVGAEQLGADGFVGLELNINTTGTVQYGEVHRSSGFAELDNAALKQVKENWTFKPCQKGDAIVGCKQYIKFRWKTN